MNTTAAIIITALVSGTIGFIIHALMAAAGKKTPDIPIECSTCLNSKGWAEDYYGTGCVKCITEGKYSGYKPRCKKRK